MSVDERVILLESGFDARSRGVNGSRGRAASREARGKVADHDVRSGTSCACAERMPKLSNDAARRRTQRRPPPRPPARDAPTDGWPRWSCRRTPAVAGCSGGQPPLPLLLVSLASPRVVVVRLLTPELGAPHHLHSTCRGRRTSPATVALHRQRSRAAARARRRRGRTLRPRACCRWRESSHPPEGCRASWSPRSLSSIRGPRRRRARTRARDERRDAAPCSSSALRDPIARAHSAALAGEGPAGRLRTAPRRPHNEPSRAPRSPRLPTPTARYRRVFSRSGQRGARLRGATQNPPRPHRARRAVRRVVPLVSSAHTCCCWLLRRTATASPPARHASSSCAHSRQSSARRIIRVRRVEAAARRRPGRRSIASARARRRLATVESARPPRTGTPPEHSAATGGCSARARAAA